MLDSVTIKSSVENLVETATIKLPATCYNAPISQLSAIRKGCKVDIFLGYDDEMEWEFSGFIESVETDPSGMVINCEDEMYLFRQTTLKDEVLKAPSVEDILKTVVKQVSGDIKVDCKYKFDYDKFTIKTATALDVLKLVQDECHCGIYFRNGTLHAHPIYTENNGTAKYDMAKNVDRDGFSLKYKSKEDRKLKVIAKGKDKNGKQIECDPVGEGGGDTETFDYKGITTKDKLTTIAREIYERKSYSGYEGSFQAWLIPVCDRGYRAELRDATAPELDGTYFVKSVETSLSSSGGVRKIELGKKL